MQPVLAVDWSALKRDESLHVLRAAATVGGRALSVWDEVHPQARYNSPAAHAGFLTALRRLMPQDSQPILLTDAGFFGVPWFRYAQAQGLACIGRLRGWTQIRTAEGDWDDTRRFDTLPPERTVDLGLCEIGKSRRHQARVVVHRNPPKGRKHRTLRGLTAQTSESRAKARSAKETRVLIVSPTLMHLSAQEIVNHYARRMQIEESFRDLKDARHGAALNHSLTRSAARLEGLILLHVLASLVAWLRGAMAHHTREHTRLLAHPQAARRALASLSRWRIGWELLKRAWPPPDIPDPATAKNLFWPWIETA